jgi:hypothetical protein
MQDHHQGINKMLEQGKLSHLGFIALLFILTSCSQDWPVRPAYQTVLDNWTSYAACGCEPMELYAWMKLVKTPKTNRRRTIQEQSSSILEPSPALTRPESATG